MKRTRMYLPLTWVSTKVTLKVLTFNLGDLLRDHFLTHKFYLLLILILNFHIQVVLLETVSKERSPQNYLRFPLSMQ